MKEETGYSEFEEALEENVPLAPFTTLGVGGPARYFARTESVGSIAAGVRWAARRDLPLFVLGGGSNIVVADSGFPGLVLRLSLRGVEARVEGDHAIVTAGAGEDWDRLVAMTIAKGWAGLECLSGIPGSAGATPIQNVGAYGQEIAETMVSLEALDLVTGEVARMGASECEFGYRASRFKSRDRTRFIISSVTYRLAVGAPPALRYAELQRYLVERGLTDPTLAETREAVIALRKRKAMVITSDDADSRSVGSFFVNPVVTLEEFERVKERAALTGTETMPSFPAGEGYVKLSAAWLIEQSGIKRGHTHGGVGTSTKHALAIVNRGAGTAREVRELAEIIKARVLGAFEVALTPEPVFVGFEF